MYYRHRNQDPKVIHKILPQIPMAFLNSMIKGTQSKIEISDDDLFPDEQFIAYLSIDLIQ